MRYILKRHFNMKLNINCNIGGKQWTVIQNELGHSSMTHFESSHEWLTLRFSNLGYLSTDDRSKGNNTMFQLTLISQGDGFLERWSERRDVHLKVPGLQFFLKKEKFPIRPNQAGRIWLWMSALGTFWILAKRLQTSTKKLLLRWTIYCFFYLLFF